MITGDLIDASVHVLLYVLSHIAGLTYSHSQQPLSSRLSENQRQFNFNAKLLMRMKRGAYTAVDCNGAPKDSNIFFRT